ncbi:GDSL-type esterase/lipase family protein [Geitlerinema sp. PCC 9228]|jgi:lysophospholipase L1-like esterase|uniref:GDSL-type esterase/lipase family protein n=1 Tax=Geitlerinema sp. PCC 9228 TaxID=111611 RepID=UPI0008F9DFB6|nr:GDSL-type esterase/lipase family protein [Geitlerinema sp. PCC 9228]
MQTLSVDSNRDRLPRSHPLRVVALGDSLIYGFGDPEGGGWVERLRRQWMLDGSPGHVVYNLGVRGDRVEQVTQRLEDEFRNRGELRNRVPDIIILSVGVNDSARLQSPQGRNFTEFSQFQKQISELLVRAQKLCPVLFVGMPPTDETKMPFLNCLYYNHQDQYRYKEATRQACAAHNLPYLDLYDLWQQRGTAWWRPLIGRDGLHPNPQGYRAILTDLRHWEPFQQLQHRDRSREA